MKNRYTSSNHSNATKIVLVTCCIVIPIALCLGVGIFTSMTVCEMQAMTNQMQEITSQMENVVLESSTEKNGIQLISEIWTIKKLGESIGESGLLAILAIAVSIWIGLNIYNVLLKEGIDKKIAEIENQYNVK